MSKPLFANRKEAAAQLLPLLQQYRKSAAAVVLGLPRGGVVIAAELAKGLELPLDVIVVKKVNPPHNDEFAVGAIAEDGESFYDWTMNEDVCGPKELFQKTIDKRCEEVRVRSSLYRKVLPMQDLAGKVAIIADDGIATGATMRVAIKAARKRGAAKIVVAVPVSPQDSLAQVRSDADEIACPHIVDFFAAVGQCYKEFLQVEDKEVVNILKSYSPQ